MSKTQYYFIWIEGLTPRSGEKIRSIVRDFDGEIHVEYTTLMTKALRVKDRDKSLVRDLLTKYGIVEGYITFVSTSYAPSGTVFKSEKKTGSGKPFDVENISDEDLEKVTIRRKVSPRGGGIEISVGRLGYRIKGVKMTAYQNYLGGGMLGSVQSDCNLKDWQSKTELVALSERLKMYFHRLTDPGTEWEGSTYEQNQTRPASAY